MRWLLLGFVMACGGSGGEGLEVDEASCGNSGRFHFVHDLSDGGVLAGGEGNLTAHGTTFVNAGLRDQNGNMLDGMLQISIDNGASSVVVEFRDLLPNGGTVDARGRVKLVMVGLDAGNCETAGFRGRITSIDAAAWKFTLVDLHASPYCSGAAFSGSFAGCVRSGSQ